MSSQNNQDPISPEIGDKAVIAKTGKSWEEWLDLLDAAGAQQMSHKEIVAYLNKHHSLKPWWQQSVTVTYEKARGLREKHQRPEGYSISASKTFPERLDELFRVWNEEELRTQWLPDAPLSILKATPGKSMRIRWEPASRIDVYFTGKGENKSQVSVQHSQLASAEEAELLKQYWRQALANLKKWLDQG
jgi:hypothetical protein